MPPLPVQRHRRCDLSRPWQVKRKSTTTFVVMLYGAGDEARTRYLHLGKVALYQMSYALSLIHI